ncbi:MAG: ThuA domain-containing protein [Clostridiales bacterium]|nr:ThuA domain-containing protein [Clostridiales bacterium]
MRQIQFRNRKEGSFKMKKALLLGDRVAKYHPVNGIDDVLRSIYDGVFDITLEEDYGNLTLGQLKQYDLVISYVDAWSKKGTKAAAAALVTYVADGGNLIAIHNGLIMGSTYELALLLGGKFTGHPAQVLIDYFKTDVDHAITERMEDFKTTEEPYMFDFDDFTEKEVLVEAKYGGSRMPAVWAHKYGWGRVVCVTPGHQVESFHRPIRKILYKAGLWCIDRI